MSAPDVDVPESLSDPITPALAAAAAAPRKRRKRAPAAGAANDCFTCATQNVKCDRRRPFCSRCLDHGKDCAGYKTQLTWGNGVASRGKLRGLSLPIAGATKLATQSPSSPPKPKRRESHTQQSEQREPSISFSSRPNYIQPFLSPEGTHGNAAFNFEPAITSPNPHGPYARPSWSASIATAPSAPTTIKSESVDLAYGLGLSLPLMSPLEGFSFSHAQTQNIPYNHGDLASPTSYSTPSEESFHLGRVMSHGSTGVSTSRSSFPLTPQYSSSYDTYAGPSMYDIAHGHVQAFQRDDVHGHDLHTHHTPVVQNLTNATALDEDIEEVRRQDYAESCAIVEDDSTVGFLHLTRNYRVSLSPLAGMGAIGATPRMQYLINYYTEVISPVIVAFDGPSNPYRTKILQLAARSETLQHAIAALSASNLRQRRETGALSTGKTDPARRSSMAHVTLTKEAWKDVGLLTAQQQAREESLHKGAAISSLNKQLANPLLRMDDSILATLLMLCLFHICDSGVAKFQTQFAGVKKLLSLRKGDVRWHGKDTHWITRMFTWFDAMTATVNDREGQLQGPYLDLSAFSDEEWALENLAGCDGQLFKVVAQLGRLNVLSQGKSVLETPNIISRPLPPQCSPSPGLAAGIDHNYSNFDGNGWMRMVEDETVFSTKTASATGHESPNTQFWREWREIRHALQMWKLDSSLFDATSPAAPYLTTEQRFDLANISESFRYSALLYTERLANPTVPSTDPCIRGWVQQCLNYIKAVRSDVYLLWPLFITGSECVDPDDRSVIRERCLDIQKDSGFMNNQSCLELLEKVWKRYDDQTRTDLDQGRGGTDAVETGFRFSTIMRSENNEGEYIVV